MENKQENWSISGSKSRAALVYGDIEEGRAPMHILARFGQEAYETLQLHIYMTELLRVRDEAGYICWSPGFGLLWAGLEAIHSTTVPEYLRKNGGLRVEEIGSTLFATIDKLAKLKVCHKGRCDILKVRFIGVEPSRIFMRTAEVLHPGNEIQTVPIWRDLPPPNPSTLARSYQATSYAFRSVAELCDWIARAVCSVHGLWISPGNEDQEIILHGKRVVFFSLEKMLKNLSERGFRILPISSDSYALGGHRFLSVFICVHKFAGEQAATFTSLSRMNGHWGLPFPIDQVPSDPANWIRANVVSRESHAGFIEADIIGQSNPMLNFSSVDAIRQYREHLAASNQIPGGIEEEHRGQ